MWLDDPREDFDYKRIDSLPSGQYRCGEAPPPNVSGLSEFASKPHRLPARCIPLAALSSLVLDCPDALRFILDTGAAIHVINRFEILEYLDYIYLSEDPQDIIAEDGRCKVRHQINVRIPALGT